MSGVVFIQVIPGPVGVPSVKPEAWHPWICQQHPPPKELEKECIELAAYRHVRDRGGVGVEEAPYEFTVYSYTKETPTHPNGRPVSCTTTTYHAPKGRGL